MEDLSQKDFEKDFQNVNRIAIVKSILLKMNFKKIFKMIFNNSIEFLSWLAVGRLADKARQAGALLPVAVDHPALGVGAAG